MFTEEIPFPSPNSFHGVKLYQDKTTNHSLKTTTAVWDKNENIEYILFQRIPAKSPDFSPVDYCAFNLLKRALSKSKFIMIDGLWKNVE